MLAALSAFSEAVKLRDNWFKPPPKITRSLRPKTRNVPKHIR